MLQRTSPLTQVQSLTGLDWKVGKVLSCNYGDKHTDRPRATATNIASWRKGERQDHPIRYQSFDPVLRIGTQVRTPTRGLESPHAEPSLT